MLQVLRHCSLALSICSVVKIMPLGRSHDDDTVLVVKLPGAIPAGGLIAALVAETPDAMEYTGPPPKIGIVTMTKRPTCFTTWLEYHRERCGVARFYVRVEETPELAAQLEQPPWNRIVETTLGSGPRDYFAQMDRQSLHIADVLPRAREAGLDFLLHIDDDELLYCPLGLPALHAALARAPAHAVDLHIQNLEAYVPSVAVSNPFHECTAFKHRTNRFCAYSNGKAFGRLSCAGLAGAGPHHYRRGLAGIGTNGSTHEIPPTVAVVLHYESATFQAWRRKFLDLAHRHSGSESQALIENRAPSAFYLKSMAAMAAVDGAQRKWAADIGSFKGAAEVEEAEAAAQALYCEWKLQPSDLPLPPSDQMSAQPLVLLSSGVTIVNVLAQPRVVHLEDEMPLLAPAINTPAAAAVMGELQMTLAAATDGDGDGDGDSLALSSRLAQLHARCTRDTSHIGSLPCTPASDEEWLLLKELVVDLGGIDSAHAQALREAGYSVGALLRSNKQELESLAKAAGLPLGVRLRLRGAINKVFTARGDASLNDAYTKCR